LIEQLEKDHIVSVLVDEAQDLSDEMLEELRLLSNLETDRAKLIQIVLMGQPELEQKLDQPELRQLKQRVAMRCRLAPLSSDEVAPYINSRLHTVGYEGKELFDPGSVQKIALYSKGIPRLINVICDNALLIAYATSKSKVSAKIIDEVARDLQLAEPSQVKLAVAMPEGRKEAFRQPWRQNFQPFPATETAPQQRTGGVESSLLAIVILAGTVLYTQQSGSLAALKVKIEDLVGTLWKNPSQDQSPASIVGDGAAQLPMPHFRMTTSQASEFLISSPIGNGITIPMRKESRETDAFPGTVDSQSSKSETPITTSTDPNKQPQPDGKTKAKERTIGRRCRSRQTALRCQHRHSNPAPALRYRARRGLFSYSLFGAGTGN
jgi:hypothetical protein